MEMKIGNKLKAYLDANNIQAEPAVRVGERIYSLSEPYPKSLDAEHGLKLTYKSGRVVFFSKSEMESVYGEESNSDQLENERIAVSNECKALRKFMSSAEFGALSDLDKSLANVKLHHMLAQREILEYSVISAKGKLRDVVGLQFGNALAFLELGYCLRRHSWKEGLVVFKQIPAKIYIDAIPNMLSLPKEAKKQIIATRGIIQYKSQCIVYNTANGIATSWVPTMEDLFADDWELVITE